MKAPITTQQAMLHPAVVATINLLSEMAQRLQDENDALKAAVADEREALETKDWTAIMREGGLVTWGDAEELGERVRAVIEARGNT